MDRVHVLTDILVVQSTQMVQPHLAGIVNQYVVMMDQMVPRLDAVISMEVHYIGIQPFVHQ